MSPTKSKEVRASIVLNRGHSLATQVPGVEGALGARPPRRGMEHRQQSGASSAMNHWRRLAKFPVGSWDERVP
jgi:hypothetical protein